MFSNTLGVGSFGLVTIQAQDQYGNVALSESAVVEASATGSAIGAAVVTVHSGVGSFYFTDTVTETVTLSLMDTYNTGLDVSNTIQVTFVPGKRIFLLSRALGCDHASIIPFTP